MARPTSTDEIEAVATILRLTTRCGNVQTDPRFTTDEQSDAQIFGYWRGLLDGHGWMVLGMEQEPRQRVGNDTRGFDNVDAVALLDWKPDMGAGVSSHVYFGLMTNEAQLEFEKREHDDLGLGIGVVRHEFLIGAGQGPRRVSVPTGEVVHVWPHRIRIFTRGCPP